MALAPVDYGPQVVADTEGLRAQREAVVQREAVFRDVHNIGSVIEGGADAVTRGILHTQALKATAAVKERQASTLQFIDSNPYVPKAVLQQRMAPDDYSAWHAGLATEYQKAESVPMFTVAGSLFDSEAKQARDAAGQIISLPGWRGEWDATERTESSTIRERYVNRLAADQMIADQRGQTLLAIDKVVDGAVKPEDIAAAAKMAETSSWLKPAERRFVMERTLAAKDAFVARQAMLAGDTEVMKAELMKLKSDNSVKLYPNMNVKQRLDLEHELAREYGYKAAKEVAEKQIVGPNVDENGKPNATAIAKGLQAYSGPNKEDVTKAVKIEEDAKWDIFNKQMAEVQQVVLKAGQDPMTARFSYAKAMQNPAARKAAAQLNKDASWLITALSKEDMRWENIDARETRAEQTMAKALLIRKSGENLEAIHKLLDDPAQAMSLRGWTPAQFDSQLYEQEMIEPDRAKARAAFAAFLKNGGKPDERPATVVKGEMLAAANGNNATARKLEAKYGAALVEAAHGFIRANPTMKPDELTDELKKFVRGELLTGTVVGSGRVWDSDTRRINWETKAEFAGKDFRLPDGTVISSAKQRTRLSKDGRFGTFDAEDVPAALADGWK